MRTLNLFENTGSTIYNWQPELAPAIAARLQEHHPNLGGCTVLKANARLRDAVERVLAQLSSAMRIERPEIFAYFVSDRAGLAAITGMCMIDDDTALETIRLNLRGPRANLAAEYIRLALKQLPAQERIAA